MYEINANDHHGPLHSVILYCTRTSTSSRYILTDPRWVLRGFAFCGLAAVVTAHQKWVDRVPYSTGIATVLVLVGSTRMRYWSRLDASTVATIRYLRGLRVRVVVVVVVVVTTSYSSKYRTVLTRFGRAETY